MFVGEWPEMIVKEDGSETYDFLPSFEQEKKSFLNGDKHTSKWRLVSLNPRTTKYARL